MSETRDFTWDPVVEPDIVLDSLRSAVFGDIPAYVTTADGRRAKGSNLGKLKDEMAEALDNADGYNMVGYSIVFNRWTRILDQDGEYMERVAPGAAAKSIKERGDRIIVQFDHGHHPLVGSIPIAAPRAVWEDERGLFAWDRLHQSWLFDPVREAIQSRAISGQSFRFTVPDGGDTWEKPGRDGLRRRTLMSVDLRERGPVVWPAYAETSVAVRALMRAMPEPLRMALSAERDEHGRDTIEDRGTDELAAHEGTDDPAADEHGPAQRVTRREMSQAVALVLSRREVIHDSDRGAA